MSKTVNLIFAIIFCFFALFMGMMGISILSAGPTNETEWTIVIFSLASATLLLYGAFQTIRGRQRQIAAELQETERLTAQLSKGQPNTPETAPQVLVCWTYPREAWKIILTKISEKTRKEEFYTAFWFPILFAIVFFGQWYIGAAVGVVAGWLYVKLRVYVVQQKFALKPGQAVAEAVISDSYLRINGNYIHYADGKYFLKGLSREADEKLGDHLHFVIGWVTSKGYPAEMDLYLPIPTHSTADAESLLEAYQKARG